MAKLYESTFAVKLPQKGNTDCIFINIHFFSPVHAGPINRFSLWRIVGGHFKPYRTIPPTITIAILHAKLRLCQNPLFYRLVDMSLPPKLTNFWFYCMLRLIPLELFSKAPISFLHWRISSDLVLVELNLIFNAKISFWSCSSVFRFISSFFCSCWDISSSFSCNFVTWNFKEVLVLSKSCSRSVIKGSTIGS